MSEEIKQYTLDQFHISYFLLMECSEYYANGDFEEANRRFYTFRSIIEEDQINGYIAFLIQIQTYLDIQLGQVIELDFS